MDEAKKDLMQAVQHLEVPVELVSPLLVSFVNLVRLSSVMPLWIFRTRPQPQRHICMPSNLRFLWNAARYFPAEAQIKRLNQQ